MIIAIICSHSQLLLLQISCCYLSSIVHTFCCTFVFNTCADGTSIETLDSCIFISHQTSHSSLQKRTNDLENRPDIVDRLSHSHAHTLRLLFIQFELKSKTLSWMKTRAVWENERAQWFYLVNLSDRLVCGCVRTSKEFQCRWNRWFIQCCESEIHTQATGDSNGSHNIFFEGQMYASVVSLWAERVCVEFYIYIGVSVATLFLYIESDCNYFHSPRLHGENREKWNYSTESRTLRSAVSVNGWRPSVCVAFWFSFIVVYRFMWKVCVSIVQHVSRN